MSQWNIWTDSLRVHPYFIIINTKIEMEKQSKDSKGLVQTYACLEEVDTLKYLNFIEQNDKKLIYRGVTEEQGRRSKEFTFDCVSLLTDKLKHLHSETIHEIVLALLRGENRSALIYGTQQSKKQKLLIGQSQNAGLLFLTILQIFNACYRREWEDKVTIKLSCWQYRDGQVSDALVDKETSGKSNYIVSDLVEGKVVLGVPQIIIRNMKSALKMVKIFMKSVEDARQTKDDESETLIFTIKLEIDNGYDKQGNVTQYLLSKFHIVKMASPYVARTQGKHPQWFISLFNYLQAEALEKTVKVEDATSEDNEFSQYLISTVIKNSHGLHCFICFTNKMSANQCLTALKFNSYLHQVKFTPKNQTINLPLLKQQQIILENSLIKEESREKQWFKGQNYSWLLEDESENMKDVLQILKLNVNQMEQANMLQYEYANVLTVACDKLEKYIFNEEIEDYFYAKKISIEITPDLRLALQNYWQDKSKAVEIQDRIYQRTISTINKIKKSASDSKEWKYVMNSKSKEKQIYEKLFALYNTQSLHFLYEENADIVKNITAYLASIKSESPQLPHAPAAELSDFTQQLLDQSKQKEKERSRQNQKPVVKEKRKRQTDELEMMFTNSNVGLCARKFKN